MFPVRHAEDLGAARKTVSIVLLPTSTVATDAQHSTNKSRCTRAATSYVSRKVGLCRRPASRWIIDSRTLQTALSDWRGRIWYLALDQKLCSALAEVRRRGGALQKRAVTSHVRSTLVGSCASPFFIAASALAY
jgi:hypothetical protein